MRKDADYYRNKHFLGQLTLRDLMEVTRLVGEFSIGVNWLPVTRFCVSRAGDRAAIFMDSISDAPDLVIPIDHPVKVDGLVVRLVGFVHRPSGREVRLKLDNLGYFGNLVFNPRSNPE